jgi:hypothetical protein
VIDGHPVSVVASGGAAWRPRTPLYGSQFRADVRVGVPGISFA